MQHEETFRVQSLLLMAPRIQRWKSILPRVQRASRGPRSLGRMQTRIPRTMATRCSTTWQQCRGEDNDVVGGGWR